MAELGTDVLDIGCGNGVVSYEIKKHFNCNLVGTDILNYLKRDIPLKKTIDEDKLDFKDNEFDLGLFNDALHHMPYNTQFKLIKEALRVCSKVIIFEVKPTFIAKAVDYLINRIHNSDMPIPLSFREEREWTQRFKEEGISFEIFNVKKPVCLYPFSNFLFILTYDKKQVN